MAGTPQDNQIKYQKLAAEYSKLRAQAQVLRKGVVDEQARSSSLTEMLKEYEQRVRKTDLEMESLNFRNQQLTKRIGVLQEELDRQAKNSHSKNVKSSTNNVDSNNIRSHVIDEELRSKIIENAQLLTTISDKEVELSAYEDKIRSLENKILQLRSQNSEIELNSKLEMNKLKLQISELNIKLSENNESKCSNHDSSSAIVTLQESVDSANDVENAQTSAQLAQARKQVVFLKQELERCKVQETVLLVGAAGDCDGIDKNTLKSTPEITEITNLLGTMTGTSDNSLNQLRFREEKLSEYFLKRIDDLIIEKEQSESFGDNLTIECHALERRLEDALNEKIISDERIKVSELSLKSLQEELSTTSHNYELQLSTMSDHLANMNETLAKQTEQIQQLEYKIKHTDGKRYK